MNQLGASVQTRLERPLKTTVEPDVVPLGEQEPVKCEGHGSEVPSRLMCLCVISGVRTFLKAGSTVDVQWATAIPHMVSSSEEARGGRRRRLMSRLSHLTRIESAALSGRNPSNYV